MALINCTECGKEISDKAVTCPHCGAPVEKVIAEQVDEKKVDTTESKIVDNNTQVHSNIEAAEALSDTASAIGWILGILFVLVALGSLTSGDISASLIYFGGALFLLPPVRNKVYQKSQVDIPPILRAGIVIGIIVLAGIISDNTKASRAEEVKQEAEAVQAKIDIEKKEKELKEFNVQKSELIKLVTKHIENKTYENALPTCNAYMKLEDKDLSPLCTKVKETVLKKEQQERDRTAAKEAAKQEAELKASMGAKAWKLHKKHPTWTTEECKDTAKGHIWIGMSYDMLKVSYRGNPDSANPSNYGGKTHWQYCWHGWTPSCFYDSNDDGIIDSYN